MLFGSLKRSASSASYLKLKDRETITIILNGPPIEFRQHQTSGNIATRTRCTIDTGNCIKCNEAGNDPAKKAKYRFRVGVIVKENGALTQKILEGGFNLANEFIRLNKEYPDLERHLLSLQRIGDGLRTVYIVSVIPNSKMDDAAFAKINEFKPLDLTPVFASSKKEEPLEDVPPPSDNDFFSTELTNEEPF